VAVHERPLAPVERAGLVEDLPRDRDLADIVQQCVQLDHAPLVRIQVERIGHREAEVDDLAAVLMGLRVVSLQGATQHGRGVETG